MTHPTNTSGASEPLKAPPGRSGVSSDPVAEFAEQLAAEFDDLSHKAEEMVGLTPDALTAAACWRSAARKTRKLAAGAP